MKVVSVSPADLATIKLYAKLISIQPADQQGFTTSIKDPVSDQKKIG